MDSRMEMCFYFEEPEPEPMKIYVGRGTKTHYVTSNGKRAICGTGDIGVGTRRRSVIRKAPQCYRVTCEKCIEKYLAS
jgi:hypothetical protein